MGDSNFTLPGTFSGIHSKGYTSALPFGLVKKAMTWMDPSLPAWFPWLGSETRIVVGTTRVRPVVLATRLVQVE